MEGRDFYYIKFKSVKYEDKPYYLCDCLFSIDSTIFVDELISTDPVGLRIFDDIEKAIEYKHNKLADEAYQATYMFEYYEISIERL